MNNSKLLDELEQNGELIYTTFGISMKPMLRHKSDIVHIKKSEGVLKRYDLPLYARDNGKLVLHRILKVKEDHYIICGDNCYTLEKVPFDAVKGYVDEFWRNKRHYKSTSAIYRLYVHLWCDFSAIRRFLVFLIQKSKRFLKKLLKHT